MSWPSFWFSAGGFCHNSGTCSSRLWRVPVESFAIGMGPKICAWHWRGIEFSLRWFPVGGVVKLGGSGAREGVSEGKPAATTPEEPARALKREGEPACGSGQDEEDKTLTRVGLDDLWRFGKGLLTRLLVSAAACYELVTGRWRWHPHDAGTIPAAPLNVYGLPRHRPRPRQGCSERPHHCRRRQACSILRLSEIAQERRSRERPTARRCRAA